VGDFSEIKEQIVTGPEEIDQAIAAAKSADVVLLALGEPRDWSGEDSSRSELTLPGRQMELFEAIVATGKPVIVVLFNGRPLALTRLQEKAAAVLEAWHPGVQGGNAVADVLFGDAEPGGRLTTSFPRSVGQVPVYYNHFNTGRPTLGKYIDGPREPLYPFGFGLTYSTFEYGKVELGTKTLKAGQSLTARMKLKNTGTRAVSEVVQLYLRALASSAGPRPVRELKGFQRVRLNPGESHDVEFRISDRELGYYDASGHWLVEPGRYQLWLTKDSVSGEPAEFELVK
jgi:beta-glucosidase